MTVKRFFISLITAAFLLMPAAAYAAEDMNTADENEIIIPGVCICRASYRENP